MKRGQKGSRNRRRLIGFSILLAAAALLPAGGLALAQGDARLAFLDEDPVEFGVDQAPGASQTVEVVNGDTRTLRRLELRVVGLPAGAVVVKEPERTGACCPKAT